jgi:hypothetical protein
MTTMTIEYAQREMRAIYLRGCLIFLPTQLVLILLGRPASASRINPLNGLAKEITFSVLLCILVIYAAARYKYNINWYYPAFVIVVGAHYRPFMFLYGIRQYVIQSAIFFQAACLGRIRAAQPTVSTA